MNREEIENVELRVLTMRLHSENEENKKLIQSHESTIESLKKEVEELKRTIDLNGDYTEQLVGRIKELEEGRESDMKDILEYIRKHDYHFHHGGWYKGGMSVTQIRSDEQFLTEFKKDLSTPPINK